MAMGNYYNNDSSTNDKKKKNKYSPLQGQIVSCYRKYFNNNNKNSSFMHGMLKYLSSMNTIETIEYCTKQLNLDIGDVVTFSFSTDKQALNPYANNVIKCDLNELDENNDDDDDVEIKDNNKSSTSPVRLICISDTHNSHNQLTEELCNIYKSPSDILIHCGDMTDSGSDRELNEVNKWFGKLPYKHIIITAGNMDGIGLDKNKYGGGGYNNSGYNNGRYGGNGNGGNGSNKGNKSSIFTNAIYLEHESYYLKEYNLRFFASPYSMQFVGGFQVNDEYQAEKLWKKIPKNTDILICHGPPLNILDLTSRGKHTGDKILYQHVINRIKPKVMCFGHMHSSFGYKKYKGIHFYNCAQNNSLNGGHGMSSYYNSNTKNNNMKNEKPHIIDLSNLS